MSTLLSPSLDRAVYTAGPVYRLTVDKYHAMIAAGILTTEDRVELLEGALICNVGQITARRTAVLKLQRAVLPLIPADLFAQFQAPVTLGGSEPEPGGAIVAGTIEQFTDHNPQMPSLCLVIEVSDTTLRQDRLLKKLLYAEAGIATYWVVDLVNQQVEVMDQPSPTDGDYRTKVVFGRGQRIPLVVQGRSLGEIAVADLLP